MQSQTDHSRPLPSSGETPTRTLPAGPDLVHLRKRTLTDYALPARLLLAIVRLSCKPGDVSDLDRCLLDGFGRILDASPARRASIAAINQLSAVMLAQTRTPPKLQHVTSGDLSVDEQLLIDAASHQLRGRHHTATSRLQWLMNPEASRQYLQAVDVLGKLDLFRQYNTHSLAPGYNRIVPGASRDCSRHLSVIHCRDLTPNERLIVNVARAWVKCISLRINSLTAVRHLSTCLGFSGLDTTMHDILHRTAYHATRLFDVRCFCCEEVSPDEARLLATLAAFEHGLPGESTELMNHWLPPTSVQGVLAQVSENRNKLSSHDMSLPMRQWDFAELEKRQILFNQDPTGHVEHSVH